MGSGATFEVPERKWYRTFKRHCVCRRQQKRAARSTASEAILRFVFIVRLLRRCERRAQKL